jgi:hypothetical protein
MEALFKQNTKKNINAFCMMQIFILKWLELPTPTKPMTMMTEDGSNHTPLSQHYRAAQQLLLRNHLVDHRQASLLGPHPASY